MAETGSVTRNNFLYELGNRKTFKKFMFSPFYDLCSFFVYFFVGVISTVGAAKKVELLQSKYENLEPS